MKCFPKLISIVLLCLLPSIVFGVDERSDIEIANDSNRNVMRNTDNSLYLKTFPDATNNTEIKEMNTKDFENHMKANGLNEGVIGTGQGFVNDTVGADKAFSANPNLVRSDYLKDQEDIGNEPSIKAWNADLQDGLIANTTDSGNPNAIGINETVKCYISRDIPIRYQCTKTGIMYGGDIMEDGLKAKTECEDECFEQFDCVPVHEEALENVVVLDNISFTVGETTRYTKSYDIDDTVKLDYITFIPSTTTINKDAKISLKITDWKDVYTTFLSQMIIAKDNISPIKLKFLQNIKKIEITVEGLTPESLVTVEDIVLTYVKNNKYVCPKIQDVKDSFSDNFAYVCPSGNLITFETPFDTYKICSDYGLVGDNIDGTFSTLDSCNSVCKQNYECKLNSTVFTTDILKDFREGCIAGQGNCESDTCKDMRINGAKVLNENVFDGNSNLTRTIINSNQIEGTERPKVLLNEDVEFEKRSAEEWKDEAYQNMITKGTYKVTSVTLDSDTEESSAYSIGLNTVDDVDGYRNTPQRGLFWNYKPKAFDINNGYSHKFYAVIEVIAERFIYNLEGKKERTKDKILYVKTHEDDRFKPFAIRKKFARNVVIENDYDDMINYQEALNEESYWEYQSFNESSLRWYTHSSGLTLESYKTKSMEMDGTYMREPIINNLAMSIYLFPGLTRRVITDGPYETYVYDGKFDGTGHGIGHYKVYAFNGRNENFTYGEIVEKLDNEEIQPIYDNLSHDGLPKYLKNDSGDLNSIVNIYTYGEIDSKSGYVHIKTKPEDIGKKGFLFIFGY